MVGDVKQCLRSFKDHLGFAIQQLKAVKRNYPTQQTLYDTLAKRMFDLYFCGWGSLKGKNSLMSTYYKKVTFDQQYRGNLLIYVGRYLCDKGDKLDKSALKKIVNFFEWRLAEGDFSNMKYFTRVAMCQILTRKIQTGSVP